MSFDNTGALLEGIRTSTGNNPFTFPPRDFIGNSFVFNAIRNRAEYAIIAGTLNPSKKALEIADPDLIFFWTRNESTVVRFSYDGYSRRWLPSPGAPPDILGPLSNTQRLVVSVPDLTVTSSPFSIYIGSPTRVITFVPQLVPNDISFTSPPAGTVQISKEGGKLNFNSGDAILYDGQTVLSTRQSFFDRTKAKGIIGQIPLSASTDYFLFLNPIPGNGQTPRIRIGFQPYLIAIQVPNETFLGSPSPGTFTWALDTGRIRFSQNDVAANLEQNTYYDGVLISSFALTRTPASIAGIFPSVAFNIPGLIGQTDPNLFIVFVELTGQPRSYFTAKIIDTNISPLGSTPPSAGNLFFDRATGDVYISSDDVDKFSGGIYGYVSSIVEVENGVIVEFAKSGVNSSGPESEPDFTVEYFVEGQVLQDGISQSPFVMLPTTPLVDSTLKFSIAQGSGSSGTFTGDLVDGTDPTKPGIGYLLDLDNHQLKFSNRVTISFTLPKEVPSIKLADAAISPLGFEAKQNGIPIIPGVDFDFDPATGLLEFLQPVGEDDPNDILGITGTIVSSNTFIASSHTFVGTNIGQSLFVHSGPNVGIYTIIQVLGNTAVVIPSFVASGSTTADLRVQAEVIADRFWTNLLPPFKKITVSTASSPAGPYIQIPNTQFTVFATTGQINLNSPAAPGQSFLVNYIWLDSPDNGVTVTPTNITEKALFKVRQETAVTTPGSNVVTFNSIGHTVNTGRPIELAIDGVNQDASTIQFIAPGTLVLPEVITTEQIILNYWVEDAPGGDTNFSLQFTPIDIDFPQVISGQNTTTLNGNQTAVVSAGSALLIGGNEVVLVAASTYDSIHDITNIIFSSTPLISSNGATIQSTGPIDGPYQVSETATVDVFPNGTNTISVAGQRPYLQNMVITVDGDAYLVSAVKFDSASNKTKISTAGPAKRNYIIPTLTRTIRPVFFADSSFNTRFPAHVGFPFTLIKMGNIRSILVNGIDYTVADGGAIKLSTNIKFGDSLTALYVGRKNVAAGTVFELNYAHAIAPASFGIAGQQLVSTYDLYAPDSFFYRVETVISFIPEVVNLLQASAKSSGTSGPNTSSQKSLQTKDFGNPSLFFDEQHLGNIDIVIQRLLKFYNDLVNQYEDILANLDGRAVGGTSGKFRYDGKLNNPPRNSFSEITNDIDDRVLLYDVVTLTGFFTFGTVPVYAHMFEPNILSRIFPTSKLATAALNNKVSANDFGKVMGSLATNNITSVGQFTSTRANAIFTSVTLGTKFSIDQNGDSENLIPPFIIGQKVRVYALDGTPDILGTITSVTGSGPFLVILDTPTLLLSGSLLQDTSDSVVTLNHFYTPGRDLSVNNDNGQITNLTFSGSLASLQNPVSGNELMDSNLTFVNSDTTPKRVSVLDGLELTDDGHISTPQLKYPNETSLLTAEIIAITSGLGNAKVFTDKQTILNATITVNVGQSIQFINGPNQGLIRIVTSIISMTSFFVNVPLFIDDAVGSDFIILGAQNILPLLNQELGAMDSNVVISSIPPALLGNVDSELTNTLNAFLGFCPTLISSIGSTTSTTVTDNTIDFLSSGVSITSLLFIQRGAARGVYRIISVSNHVVTIDQNPPYSQISVSDPGISYSILQPLVSGSGTTTPTTLTDLTANFLNSQVTNQSLLFISSGLDIGIYKISTVSQTSITIDPTAPFANIPASTTVPYLIFNPWPFINSKEVEFLTGFLRSLLAFDFATFIWASNPTSAGKINRLNDISARLSAITGYIKSITGLLQNDDKLYNTRYLWIQERTDRKNGVLVQETQAAARRVDNLAKLLADQQKLLIAQTLG
jgi:hypothetical protein